MLLLANRFFVLMPYLTAVGAGLMNHGHGKEVTANGGYEKRLQYPVNITQTNAKLAQVIISQFGGPDGELAASTLYFFNSAIQMPERYKQKGLIKMILEQRNLPISKSSARLSIS